MSQNDDPTPRRRGEEPDDATAGSVVDPAEAPAADPDTADATAALPTQDAARPETGTEAEAQDAAETSSPEVASKVEPEAATAALSRPEPELFESDDFAGATPPPSLQERAAQMRRERLARYEAQHAEDDGGPETQAMAPVPAPSTRPSTAPTPDGVGEGDDSEQEARQDGEDQTLTNPILEPEEPPFAATAVLTPDPDAQSAAAQSSSPSTGQHVAQPVDGDQGQDPRVPGVTEDGSFVTNPQNGRIFSRILQWVVAVLTPLAVLIGAVRAVASGAFMWLEYHRPGFPVDAYGFDEEQRTTLGSYGLNYINGFAGRSYLGDLQAPEGSRTLAEPKLFKESEVGHMADVQSLMHVAYLVACLAVLVIVISLLVLRVRYAGGVRRGLFAGAWATIGVLLVLGVLGALGWNSFFTDFHRLFFSGGNWEFFMDDTLIRLYPPQFWVDAAVVVAAIGLIVSAVLLWTTWPTRRRREASRNKQNARLYRMG